MPAAAEAHGLTCMRFVFFRRGAFHRDAETCDDQSESGTDADEDRPGAALPGDLPEPAPMEGEMGEDESKKTIGNP